LSLSNNITRGGFEILKYTGPLSSGIWTNEQNYYNLNVFPNPVHDVITVNVDEKEESTLLLQLNDATGRIVFLGNQSAIAGLNTYELSLSNLSKGIYTLELKSKTGSQKIKIAAE